MKRVIKLSPNIDMDNLAYLYCILKKLNDTRIITIKAI